MNIKLTITFLDETTDSQVYKIYQANYYQRGRELGEIGITSEGKVKTMIIMPYEKREGEEEGVLTINDFTTYLVLIYKVAEIKTEAIDTTTTETDTTAETTAETIAETTTADSSEECEACKIE